MFDSKEVSTQERKVEDATISIKSDDKRRLESWAKDLEKTVSEALTEILDEYWYILVNEYSSGGNYSDPELKRGEREPY